MIATAARAHDALSAVSCVGCGGPTVVITIRASARFTVSRCPQCDRRAWTIDGVGASLAEVVALVKGDGGEGSLLSRR